MCVCAHAPPFPLAETRFAFFSMSFEDIIDISDVLESSYIPLSMRHRVSMLDIAPSTAARSCVFRYARHHVSSSPKRFWLVFFASPVHSWSLESIVNACSCWLCVVSVRVRSVVARVRRHRGCLQKCVTQPTIRFHRPQITYTGLMQSLV